MFQHLGDCFSPQIHFFNMHTKCSSPSLMKPSGCLMHLLIKYTIKKAVDIHLDVALIVFVEQ